MQLGQRKDSLTRSVLVRGVFNAGLLAQLQLLLQMIHNLHSQSSDSHLILTRDEAGILATAIWWDSTCHQIQAVAAFKVQQRIHRLERRSLLPLLDRSPRLRRPHVLRGPLQQPLQTGSTAQQQHAVRQPSPSLQTVPRAGGHMRRGTCHLHCPVQHQ